GSVTGVQTCALPISLEGLLLHPSQPRRPPAGRRVQGADGGVTPDDALDGLMVFDGVCNFCSGAVQVALKADRRGVLSFTPLQSRSEERRVGKECRCR